MNRCLSIKSQLYRLRMTEKTSIGTHLSNVSSLVGQLANIGVEIPHEELVDRVPTNLPLNWDVFKLLVFGTEKSMTYEELESLIL